MSRKLLGLGALVLVSTLALLVVLWVSRFPLARYIDPVAMFPLLWLGVLIGWATHKFPQARKLLTLRFIAPKKRFYVACEVLLVLLLGLVCVEAFFLKANGENEKTTIVMIDGTTGEPLAGHPVLVGQAPTEPGDYQVTMGKRHFLLHLPKGYDAGDKKNPLSVLCLLHGDHEDDPESWGLRRFGMNPYADTDGFIAVYPIAQPVYSLWGTRYYAWNSRLGTLSFDSGFEDDVLFLARMHQWIILNLNTDRKNFHLGGFSGGAVMSTIMAQADKIPINCLVVCGGTMLEGQQFRHLQAGGGPHHIFLELNTADDIVLPNNKNGEVVAGNWEWYAALHYLGYRLDLSKPLMQLPYWRQESLANGGTEEEHIKEEVAGVYRMVTYLVRQRNGKVMYRAVYWVNGAHAWHGLAEGGDPKTPALLEFPLPERVSQFMMEHKVPPDIN